MKVVFLDFDGPIIPIMSHENRRGLMEKAWPPCIAELNRITDTTGAKIVISSSWRWGDKSPRAPELLREWGVTAEIVGETPILETAWKPDSVIWQAVCRGTEIQGWLDDNPVEVFVILDDDADMGHLMNSLVQTPFETGLTKELADRAIEMLTTIDQG